MPDQHLLSGLFRPLGWRGAALLLGTLIPGAPWLAAIPTVASQQTGFLAYPDNGPTSIGNESNASFASAQTVAGPGSASASLSESRSGVDFNGTRGTVAIGGATMSGYGQLSSANEVHVTSVANPLPHGQGLSEGLASFEDYVTLSNPLYGGAIPVTLHVNLAWDYGFNDVAGGSNSATNWAIAQAGLEWFGSLMLYNLQQHAGSYYHEDLIFSNSLSGFVGNAATLRLFGSLSVRSASGLNSQGTVSAPFGEILSHSNAIADIYLEVPTGTVLTSTSGHDYRLPSTSVTVPDSPSPVIPGLAVLACLCLRRRWPAGSPFGGTP